MGPKSEVKPSLAIAFYVVVKFIYSEKATKFCEISTLLLSYVVPVKSRVEISQNLVAFSEYIYELYVVENEIKPNQSLFFNLKYIYGFVNKWIDIIKFLPFHVFFF